MQRWCAVAAAAVFVFGALAQAQGPAHRVSTGLAGEAPDCISVDPTLSADGRFVVFQSYASNLVAGDTNGVADVFVHDCVTGATTRVSVGPHGRESNGYSGEPAISADGRVIAFRSDATNLVAGDTNGVADVFVHERVTGRTYKVSTCPAGVPAKSMAGSVSAPLRPSVMWAISSVLAIASCGLPPTNCTIAGDAAMAKPPTPAVSVIALSPRSGAASAVL